MIVIFILLFYIDFGFEPTLNVSRAGDRNPVLRLRQDYGACTLLVAGYLRIFPSILFKKSFLSVIEISLSKFNFSIVVL